MTIVITFTQPSNNSSGTAIELPHPRDMHFILVFIPLVQAYGINLERPRWKGPILCQVMESGEYY
jgi:hypothetical protein